jgi:hypothetical protein
MMPSLFLAALAVGSLALGGCATPLNVQKSGGDVASIIGVPSAQIKFIGYCGWGDVRAGGKNQEGGGQGLIVLTDDSIILLKGDLPAATVQRKIKYKEISGVDVRHFIRARQLQILQKDVVVVMEITKNKAMVDQAGTERAAQILRGHGVLPFKGKKYYRPRIRPPLIIFIPV